MTFPKDVVFKVVTRIHRAVFDLSHGKLAGEGQWHARGEAHHDRSQVGSAPHNDADQPTRRW